MGLLIDSVDYYFGSGRFFYLDILVSIFLVRLVFLFLERKNVLDIKYCKEILIFCILSHFVFSFFISYGTLSVLFAYLGFLTRKFRSDKRYLIILVTIIIANYFYQIMEFGLTDIYFLTLFSLISLYMMYQFMNFELRTYDLFKENFINKTVMFISRFSLQIYFIHYVIFIVLSYQVFGIKDL